MNNLLSHDLDYILNSTYSLWEELRDQRIFITGGTGFFGCWLLESFVWVNKKLNLNAEICVLTRNKKHFAAKYPHLFNQPSIQFYEGDVRDFEYPLQRFSYFIHAATDTNAKSIQEDPISVFNSIVQGTKHTLEFARYCGAKKFLLVSSGAVYGKQPTDLTHIPESYPSVSYLTEDKSTYAVGKCAAEHLAYLYAKQYKLDIKIARCFAFVGPYLPLNGHFAIGNFIYNLLHDEPIQIKGDGTPFRSYLYAADLAIWLWTILFKGKTAYPYNVGSDEDYDLQHIACIAVSAVKNSLGINVMLPRPEKPIIERYVPDISRARSELKLTSQIKLIDAIKRTVGWYANILQKSIA